MCGWVKEVLCEAVEGGVGEGMHAQEGGVVYVAAVCRMRRRARRVEGEVKAEAEAAGDARCVAPQDRTSRDHSYSTHHQDVSQICSWLPNRDDDTCRPSVSVIRPRAVSARDHMRGGSAGSAGSAVSVSWCGAGSHPRGCRAGPLAAGCLLSPVVVLWMFC